MKRCPRCNRVESDEALVFCRADGTALISDSSAIGTEAGTVRIGSASATADVETSILPRTTEAVIGPGNAATATLPAPAPFATTALGNPHRRKTAIAIVSISASLLVVLVAIATYSYFAKKPDAAIQSIAVMPFINANNDPNSEYLADGIPVNITNSLSQLPNLKVMSSDSVSRYKGKDTAAQTVAKELKVQAVLIGRVAQRGDGLTINVELINAQDNSQIWGQVYNPKLADVFAVAEEIAKAISDKLSLKLTGTERQQLAKRPTENIKAFQYYMQGRSATLGRTREDLKTAIGYYEKALAEDQNYALAYAGLADVYAQLGVYGYIPPIEGRGKVQEMARRALSLDENLADSHVALGEAYIQFAPYDFSQGDRELRKAIEISPSLALAHFYLGVSLARQGRFDESLEQFLKAREFDPLSSTIARNVAHPYYLRRDYMHALSLLREANELGPALTSTWEIGVYIQSGSFNEVLTLLEKARRERKNDPILIYSAGWIYAAQGKRAEALQMIKELEEMSGQSLSEAAWTAKIYAALNEKEQALRSLEQGLATGALGSFYKDDPVWDPLRSDPRFIDLLRRMGFLLP